MLRASYRLGETGQELLEFLEDELEHDGNLSLSLRITGA
jgi:hypothetical protein